MCPVRTASLWNDTTIRGHGKRGTGIINNEVYIGQLIWNRLRYIKDPSTGKRVSRLNRNGALRVLFEKFAGTMVSGPLFSSSAMSVAPKLWTDLTKDADKHPMGSTKIVS